jgi:hypothetical protein
MNSYKRFGKKWTITEILSLQREYELLELSIQDIAVKHQRSVSGILFKLEDEGFIINLESARGYAEWYYSVYGQDNVASESEDECDEVDDNDDDYDNDDNNEDEENSDNQDDNNASEVDELTDRVWSLETSVQEIKTMVAQMFQGLVNKKTVKRAPLRSTRV